MLSTLLQRASYRRGGKDMVGRGLGRYLSNGSSSHYGESIPSDKPEEYVEEGDETEGEWKGCTRSFLAPISITSRGSEILNNPVSCRVCVYYIYFY